jgi:hypothetical protein
MRQPATGPDRLKQDQQLQLEGSIPMRNKLSTMIAVCGLTILACMPVSMACDKDKNVAQDGSKRTATTYVVGTKTGCSKAGQAKTVQASAGKSACCPKTGKPVTVQASAGVQDCPAENVMKQLAMALMDMNERGGADAAGRAEVVKAMRMMADSKPGLACDKVAKLLASENSGDSGQVITVATGGKSQCSSKRAKNAQIQAASNKAACDPANCDPSKCSKGAKVIAAGGSTRGTAASARYVAYDCQKTDRLARAVARAYLDLMRELKISAGAEGCSATTAKEVLASVLDDMQAEQTAAASTIEPIEGVAKIETVDVSFGAVSDKSDAPKRTCGSRN